MADLTQKDIDNYNKLKGAFGNIKFDDHTTDPTLDPIKKIREKIGVNKLPVDTEELRHKLDLLDLYVKVSFVLEKTIIFNGKTPEEAEKNKQKFSDAIEDLKDSLEVVEAENLDLTEDIERLRPDSLFFDFIAPGDSQTWTKKLIDNLDLNLSQDATFQLLGAWGTAVNLFTENARQKNEKLPDKSVDVTPFRSDTFAHFFRIHKELEILYGKLAETETFQKYR